MTMTGMQGSIGLADGPGPVGQVGPVASVEDLRVTFRRGGRNVHALRGVTLHIAPGEIVGLVGESGSGKSVLGLSLLGLHPKASTKIEGTVMVCGQELTSGSAEEWRLVRRRYLGAVFQDPMTSLNPTMRIGRQVAEVAGNTDEAVRLLNAVGIADASARLSSFPHELSGGLRQRVMLAMAIAGTPRLVIADEPTTALDVTVQAQILRLLRRLRDDLGMAMLFVTHDLGVASQVADRIAVLYGGRLMEVGESADILERAVHPYSNGLLRSRLTLLSGRDRPVVSLAGEPPDPTNPPEGCPFCARCAFVEDLCRQSIPEPVEIRRHHQVACARAGSLTEITDEALAPWPQRADPTGLAVLVHAVTKTFSVGRGRRRRPLHSLRGVDLEIAPGEVVALVGESGSGKSTLLRAIAGLLRVDSGSVEFGVPGDPQMVFQDAGASLTPWLAVGALIAERLGSSGLSRAERRQRVEHALASVGLPPEVRSAKPRQLSGGQRQRVALARAIAVVPPLLLCDEPTSALDVSLAATILNLIGQLRRELSMAVLFVTHDLAVARIVADRVAVMYLGRIVEIGPVDSVVGDPKHPYTAALLASVPDPGVELKAVMGEPASPLDIPIGCGFASRCASADELCHRSDPQLDALSESSDGPIRSIRRVACFHPVRSDEALGGGGG